MRNKTDICQRVEIVKNSYLVQFLKSTPNITIDSGFRIFSNEVLHLTLRNWNKISLHINWQCKYVHRLETVGSVVANLEKERSM
jgi:hypothetical protein